MLSCMSIGGLQVYAERYLGTGWLGSARPGPGGRAESFWTRVLTLQSLGLSRPIAETLTLTLKVVSGQSSLFLTPTSPCP